MIENRRAASKACKPRRDFEPRRDFRHSPASARAVVATLLAAVFAGGTTAARAADYSTGPAALPEGGVACSIGQPFWVPSNVTAEELPWPSVYYAHFSGGRPYVDAYGRTIIDWRDEHVCFPTSGQCRAFLSQSRHAYHQPEGWQGCLLLR